MQRIIFFISFLFSVQLNFAAVPAPVPANIVPTKKSSDPEDPMPSQKSFFTSFVGRATAFSELLTKRDTKKEHERNGAFLKKLDENFDKFSPAMRERLVKCYHNPNDEKACAQVGGKSGVQAVEKILKMQEQDKRQQEEAHFKDPQLAARTKKLLQVCHDGGYMTYENCDDLDKLPKDILKRELAELHAEQRSAAQNVSTQHNAQPDSDDESSRQDTSKTQTKSANHDPLNIYFKEQLTDEDKKLIAQMIKDGTLEITAELAKATKASAGAKAGAAAQAKSTQAQLNRIAQALALTKYKQEQEELEQAGIAAGRTAEAIGTGLSLLARATGDANGARKLRVFGKETKAFIKGSVAAFSGDPVMGGLAMADAFVNLMDGMQDPEENIANQLTDMQQAILDAIAEAVRILSAEMKKNTQEIIGEIHDLKQLVGEHHGQAMAKFFELHAGQKNIFEELKIIHQDLHDYHNNSAQTTHQQAVLAGERQTEITTLFSELPMREIDEQFHRLNAQVKREMNAELLGKIIEKYYSFVTILASSASLTGSHISNKNPERIAEALDNAITDLTDTPAVCQSLNLLVRAYETMLKKSIASDLKERISNPVILNKCIKQLTDLIQTFLNSRHCTFASKKDQDLCLQYLAEIAEEQERCQKTVAWLLDPKFNQEILAQYKKTVTDLNTQITDFNQQEFVQKTRDEIKNRLRSIVEIEKGAIAHMIPPQFPKLKHEILAFDNSMTTAIESVRDNWAQGSQRPFVSRSSLNGLGAIAVQCFFYNDLAGDSALEAEARRDDLSSAGITDILQAKQNHWFKVRQNLLQLIDANLAKRLALVDTFNCTDIQANPALQASPTIHSIIYPAQPDANHLLLVAPEILQATDTAKALVDLGQATLRYTYAPEENHLIITAWLKQKDIETHNMSWKTSTAHTQPLSSDEDIYNFWYGGRYCRDDRDSVTVAFGSSAAQWYGQPDNDTRRHIATHRYPSSIQHPGFYNKPNPFVPDINKAPEQKAAIAQSLKLKQLKSYQNFVHQLNDTSNSIGKTICQQNILYSMLCAALAMYGGTLEPNLAIINYQKGVSLSQQIRNLLKTNPTEINQNLIDITALCAKAQTFTGPHQLLDQQSEFLNTVKQMHAICATTPIVAPVPAPATSDLMKRFDQMADENNKLKEQNEKMLAILAAIAAKM